MATKVSNPYNFNIKDDYNSYADIRDPYIYKFYWGMGENSWYSPWGFDKIGVLDEYLYNKNIGSSYFRGLIPDNINGTEVMAIVTKGVSRLYFKDGAEPYPVISIDQYKPISGNTDKEVSGILFYPEEESGIPNKVYKSKNKSLLLEFYGSQDLDYYPLNIYCFDGINGPIPDENGYVDLTRYSYKYIKDSATGTEIPEENLRYLNSGVIFTNMAEFFSGYSLIETLDLSDWDTSNVTIMSLMFVNCIALKSVTGSLDLSSCTNVHSMFLMCNPNANIHLKNVPRSLDFSNSGGTEGQQYIIDNYID